MKTISIKGVGKARRNPDLVIFRISTSARREEYSQSIDASNRLVNDLKRNFEEMGFPRDDLKTVSFNTRPIYQSVEVGLVNKTHRRELECFEVSHDLKIEFDLDNDRINEVLKCLKGFGDDVQFEIDFSVKDKESMKRDVIVDATKTARFNAEVLCEASSVELGDLVNIEYNWVDFNFYSRSYYDLNANCMSDRDDFMEFNPDAIEISDSVSFVWEIR